MPVTYSIDTPGKIIRTTCSRPLKFEEVIEHFQTLQKDPACTGYLDVVLDVSDAEATPESSQLGSVKAELAAVREQVQFGICAIVAGRDAMYGMMRVFEVFAGQYFRAIRVFHGSAEAEAWLASQRAAVDTGTKSESNSAQEP